MKILFVSAVLPYPLYSGGQIRIYNLLKRLSKQHEIHLYSFIRSEREKSYLPQLSFCKNVVTVLRGHAWQPKYLFKTVTTSYPLLWNTYHNSEMLSLLSDEVANGSYDLMHIEPGYVWPSIPTEHKIPIVIAEHNIEHEVYGAYAKQFSVAPLRPFMSLDVAKMAKWEARSWKEASGIVAVSEEDKQYIVHSNVDKNVTVIPNGVDVDTFPFRPKKKFLIDAPIFLYVGNFLWMENRDAVEHIVKDIWPVIKSAYPHARLRIVGKHAGSYVRVGQSDAIQVIESAPVIQEELQAADVMMALIRIGGGTKYKILEAMASGLPVITSMVGAQGMRGVHGKHYHVAVSVQEVLRSIKDLSVDAHRTSMLQNARALVEKEYSWDMVAGKLDAAWRQAI